MTIAKKKKICVVTGGRAEYGLMRWLLKGLKESEKVTLQLIVTGMHLSTEYGKTISEIEIACLAGDIPEAIEVDITNLMLNEAIRLSEITLPEGAEIPGFDEENDQMIVSVNPPRAEEEEPEIIPEGEEGEVVEGEEASADQDDSGDAAPEEAESSD